MYSDEERLEIAERRKQDPRFEQESKTEERAWYSYGASIPASIARGGLSAVQNTYETTAQIGAIAGTSFVDYTQLDQLFGEELDEDKKSEIIAQKLQEAKQVWGDIQRPKDPVDNFFFGASEAMVGFIPAFKIARGAGLGVGAAGLAGGAAEGFIASDVDDASFVEGMYSTMLASSPEAAENFRQAMDVEQSPSAANILLRKSFSGLEMALLGAAGEKAAPLIGKAVDAASPVVKEAAQSAFKKLPESAQKKALASVQQAAEVAQKVRRWKAKGQNQGKGFSKFVKEENAKSAMSIKNDLNAKFDESLPLLENIKNSIIVNTNDAARIYDSESYSTIHNELVKQLDPIAEKMADDAIRLKATRQATGQDKTIGSFFKDLGEDYNQFKDKEKRRASIEIMAHNLIVENGTINFAQKQALYKAGKISDREYVDSFQDVLLSVTQRSKALAAPATAMRTAQDIAPKTSKFLSSIKDNTKDIEHAERMIEAIGASEIPAQEIAEIVSKAGRALWNSKMAGATPDEIAKMILKSNKAAVSEKGWWSKLKKFGDHLSRTYTANLMSATPTLAQNTLGPLTHGYLMAAEDLVKAAGNQLFGVKNPQMTFRRAIVEFGELHRQAFVATKIMLRSTWQAAKDTKAGRGISTTQGIFMDDMGAATKSLSPSIKAKMFKAHKEDIIPEGEATNSINAAIDAVGKPIFGIIKRQDAASKMVTANKKMAGFANQAVYISDDFGIAEMVKPKRLGKAREIVHKAILEGKVFDDAAAFTDREIALMGISKDDAAKLALRVKSLQEKASAEAMEDALEVAMQSQLSKPVEKFGEFLQQKVPFGRFFVPFFNTPMNIISKTIERLPVVPLGEGGVMGLPVHPKFYQDFAAGGERRKTAISKAVTGMAIVSIGRDLAEAGLLVPTQTTVQDRIASSEMLGINNAGIKIGDDVFNIAFMGPLGYLLLYGANAETISHRANKVAQMTEDSEQTGFDDMLLANIFSLGQMVTEAPYMKPLEDLMGAVEVLRSDPDESERKDALGSFLKHIAGMAGNLVPYSSLQRQVAKDVMEFNNLSKTAHDKFYGQFAPYLNDYKAYDFFSEPEKTPEASFILKATSRFSQIQDSDGTLLKLFQESHFRKRELNVKQAIEGGVLLDWKYGHSMKSDFSVRVELSPEQFDYYHKVRREMNPKKRLKQLVNSKFWKENLKVPDGINRNTELANKEWNVIHKAALQKTVLNFPELQDAIAKERKTKRGKRSVSTGTLMHIEVLDNK